MGVSNSVKLPEGGDAFLKYIVYVDRALKASPLGRDCLKLAEDYLLKHQWADPKTILHWRKEVQHEVEETLPVVQREGGPAPYREDRCALVIQAARNCPARISTGGQTAPGQAHQRSKCSKTTIFARLPPGRIAARAPFLPQVPAHQSNVPSVR